jgi:hypothetical protein
MFFREDDGAYSAKNMSPNPLQVHTRLPAGMYIISSLKPLSFQPLAPDTERLFAIDTLETRILRREVEEFFDPATTVRLESAGLTASRGIILHGPPGVGKRSMMWQLIPFFIEHDAVVIHNCNFKYLAHHHPNFWETRPNEPERPIVLLFDQSCTIDNEIALIVRIVFDEMIYVPDRLLMICCTDDPEDVAELTHHERLSFGLVLQIDRLAEGVYERLVEQKYPTLSPADRQFVVRLTQNLPIDYLEEACKLLLMGYDPDEISDRLQAIQLDSDDDDDS